MCGDLELWRFELKIGKPFTQALENVCAPYMVIFYVRQLYREVLLRARISYGNSVCLSVHPSVTTRYGFNAR